MCAQRASLMVSMTGEFEASLPLRVGAIDVGSNAIRFMASEFSAPKRFEVLDQIRCPVRLGHDVFLTGRLAPDALDAAVVAIVSFRKRMDELGVTEHRAVATSAVRDSKNGEDLIKRVRHDADIELEVITGAEEARLAHIAVSSRIDLGRRHAVSRARGVERLHVCPAHRQAGAGQTDDRSRELPVEQESLVEREPECVPGHSVAAGNCRATTQR